MGNDIGIFPPTIADHAHITALHQCHSVRRFLGGALDPAQAQHRSMQLLEKKGGKAWVIRCSANIFVGTLEFSKHCEYEALEITYLIKQSAWGKGYGRQALIKGINLAHTHLKQKKLLAETQQQNSRSKKLLTHMGFQKIKTVTRFGALLDIYALSDLSQWE